MSARRWPVITFTLIGLNCLIFLATNSGIERQAGEFSETKAHLLMLAAMHPDLILAGRAQQFVKRFQETQPELWQSIQNPQRRAADSWDARIRMSDDPWAWQREMDGLARRFEEQRSASVLENYAFVPADPQPLTYLTANFLHGGWLHLIGNMWFLWLAGFVLEDAWGRAVYSVFYVIAGAAALQMHLWTNAGSLVPTLGASGAVAALMGAFLVRYPKLKIEMGWLLRFRLIRFKMAAYWLLPLWLLMEIMNGTVFGAESGVAHWAHVGGFVFGAVIALSMKMTGWEHKLNEAVENEVTLKADPAVAEASALLDQRRFDEAMPRSHSTCRRSLTRLKRRTCCSRPIGRRATCRATSAPCCAAVNCT